MKGFTYTPLVIALLLAAPRLYPQTVKVNWQTKAAFSDYKTYVWKFTEKRPPGFYRQWVVADVDSQLTKKGLRIASGSQQPDIYVVYNFLAQEMIDSTTTTDGFDWAAGPWSNWGAWGGWGDDAGDTISTTETQPRSMGILTVDLVDAKSNVVVWRGQATEDAISNTQSGDERQIRRSVEKMMKDYPPK